MNRPSAPHLAKRALVAAVAAGSLSLTACSGALPEPPATSATAPLSTATAPVPAATGTAATAPATATKLSVWRVPEAARPHTKSGAEAFSRFFFEQLNRGYKDSDPTALDGLYEASCETCKNLRGTIERLEADGGHYVDDVIVVEASTAESFEPRESRVNVLVRQLSTKVEDTKGKHLRTGKEGTGTFTAILTFNNGWKISLMGVQR